MTALDVEIVTDDPPDRLSAPEFIQNALSDSWFAGLLEQVTEDIFDAMGTDYPDDERFLKSETRTELRVLIREKLSVHLIRRRML